MIDSYLTNHICKTGEPEPPCLLATNSPKDDDNSLGLCSALNEKWVQVDRDTMLMPNVERSRVLCAALKRERSPRDIRFGLNCLELFSEMYNRFLLLETYIETGFCTTYGVWMVFNKWMAVPASTQV